MYTGSVNVAALRSSSDEHFPGVDLVGGWAWGISQAHSVLHRSHYSFGGAQGQASNYWQQVPSWEDVKGYAADTKALPEPSLWQHTKSIVTRKPIRQVQVRYCHGRRVCRSC